MTIQVSDSERKLQEDEEALAARLKAEMVALASRPPREFYTERNEDGVGYSLRVRLVGQGSGR
jgi:hypothetical protein